MHRPGRAPGSLPAATNTEKSSSTFPARRQRKVCLGRSTCVNASLARPFPTFPACGRLQQAYLTLINNFCMPQQLRLRPALFCTPAPASVSVLHALASSDNGCKTSSATACRALHVPSNPRIISSYSQTGCTGSEPAGRGRSVVASASQGRTSQSCFGRDKRHSVTQEPWICQLHATWTPPGSR